MTDDRAARIDAAVQRIITYAERLPPGGGEHHVQVSARELASACARGEGVRAAVDRLASSVRQLQTERSEGSRRRERHDAQAIERLLEALQEDLLPELRRSGLL
jgi:hypothetical protein